MQRKPWIRKLLPWIVALLLLATLSWRVPIADLVRTMQAAQLGTFLPLLGGACVAWFLVDAAAYAYLFSRFNAPLSRRQARELRGLTYLLTPVHWNLGRGAIIARLRQTHRVPVLEATSSMALYQTLDALLLSALSWIGLAWMPASDLTRGIQPVVSSIFMALVIYLAVLFSSHPRTRFFERLRKSKFHRSHLRARPRDIAMLLTWRLAYYVIFVGVYFWGPPAFGFDLPLPLVIASVPIIQAIGSLPISPAGLGTQQAAMLYLFAGHATEAAIIAFGLSFPLITIVLRSLIGTLYLTRIAPPTPASDSASTASMARRFG